MDNFFQRKDNMLAVAWCMSSLAYSIVYPFIPLYLHLNRGLDMATVGLIFPIMGIGIIGGPAIAGILVDHFGRRKILVGGLFWRGIIFILLAIMVMFDSPFYLFAIALMLSSGVGTFFQNASDAYLTDITKTADRPRAYSKIRVGANIGWAFGPMLGAFLATTPFSLLFAITAALCLISALFVWKTCPEIETRAEPQSTANVSVVGGGLSWARIVQDRPFMATMVLSFVLYLLVSQLYSTLSVYTTGVVGITKNMLGFVYSVNGLTVVLLQIPLTRLLDHSGMSLNVRLVCGAVLYAVGYFTAAFAGVYWHLMISVAILTLGEIMAQPTLYAVVSRMAPRDGVGRYMGVLGLIRGLGFAIGPYIGALLFQKYSSTPMMLWGILALFGLGAAAGFWMLSHNSGKTHFARI